MRYLTHILQGLCIAATVCSLSSCNEFIFGNVGISDEENPLLQKKTPRSGAEIYYGDEEGQHTLPIDKNAVVNNPDPNGAFADWYTCLVMMKEGHSHYYEMMHGNPVYTRKVWRQEQFAEVRNTSSGMPEVRMDRKSIRNFLEEQRNEEGPEYFRLIGGISRMWGCCLYFYDKEGKFLNDSILKHSDQYQIFFSISDTDDKGKPYKVKDVRYREGMPDEGAIDGVEAEFFKGKDSFEQRREVTEQIFQYTYRDTWTHADMGDGARNLFNIKLLPPLGKKDIYDASTNDKDCVGLKGHFHFDFLGEIGLDKRPWPLKLSENVFGDRTYTRPTYLLPHFYLAVRVMKCDKQKKAVVPAPEGAQSGKICAPFHAPASESEWKEIIRFNIPIKIFCSSFDSDPTRSDPYEPFYYHIAREIMLSPEETYEAVIGGGTDGGMGYDSWFL
ncbi:hypothetical protein AB9N12_13275 [Bacteroides sp. AN502(2024)]|uniref:hypothetical protein n=1 Tax=Bacteroides sp. AN502(2024) TaxID=3160599 RepID=UPI0035191C1F